MEYEEELRRLPLSLSAFIALSSLTPPSPILSPTQLTDSCTSGDIPILLEISGSDPATPGLDRRSVRANSATFEVGINPSSSARTIETTGTFGVVRKYFNPRDSNPWSPERRTFWGRDSVETLIDTECILSSPGRSDPPALAPAALPSLLPHAGYYDNISTGLESRFTISAYLNPSKNDVSAMDQESDAGAILRNDLDNWGDVGSPTKNMNMSQHASSLPRSSYSNEDTQNETALPIFVSESVADCRLPLGSLPTHQIGSRPSSSCSKSREGSPSGSWVKCKNGVSAAQLASSGSNSTPCTPKAPDRDVSEKSRDRSARSAGKQARISLPMNLAWMNELVVELYIDQEGFRAVQAVLKLSGYLCQRSLDSSSNNSDANIVQFRPITRQIFNFHYAPFDSLPTLRRITINREQSRDYITRQASLSLKSNGVYTVRGIETSSLPPSHTGNVDIKMHQGSDALKLHWTFDYLVDDRRVEASGRILDGEKTLTPLNFACSPILLHPLQGKRIRLMHVVKKSVATKLVAEKMKPPTRRSATPTLSPSPSGSVTTKGNPPVTAAHFFTKSHVWNMHRRAQSHAPRPKHNNAEHAAPGFSQPTTISVKTESLDPIGGVVGSLNPSKTTVRRRRASSAGEWNRQGCGLLKPNTEPYINDNSHVGLVIPARHIIPLSRLAELDAETEKIATIPRVDPSGFQPLTPSPRHHQTKRRSYRCQND